MKLNMVGPYLISQLIGGVLGASMSKVRVKPDISGHSMHIYDEQYLWR